MEIPTYHSVSPPPFQKGENPNFENLKKGEPEKKILGWGKSKGGEIFKMKGLEPNFSS